ncbi:MAG: zinc ribbon domain-containing protein [Candidatus Ornithomonoglobus sp.]
MLKYKCPKCGEKISQLAKYCPACRFPLDMLLNEAARRQRSVPFYERCINKCKSTFKNHKTIALFNIIFLSMIIMGAIIVSIKNNSTPTSLDVAESIEDIENEEPEETEGLEENLYACATQTAVPTPSESHCLENRVLPTVPPEYGAPGGLDGYWYDYQVDMEIYSSVMYFTEDGLYYRKTWRQIDAGTYYINDSSVYVQYDSYFNYAVTNYYTYLDSGSATYELKENNIIGFKYLHSDAISDGMLNSTIKGYASDCSEAAGIAVLSTKSMLHEYSGHCIRALYQDEPYKVYNDIGVTDADISGDDIPELLAVGITDDSQIGYIEIYKIEHGILFRILGTCCLEYNGMSNYPVMLYGDYYICCDSSSLRDGYKKSICRYSDITHSWEEIYNTKILFDDTGNQIKGYIVNDELVSKTQYDKFNNCIERGRFDIFDFQELDFSNY